MTRFFAGVLSVIAVGVMLIAYGLLKPGPAAYTPDMYAPGVYPAAYAPGAYPGIYAPGGTYLPGNVPNAGQAAVPMIIVPQPGGPALAIPTVAAPAAQVVEVPSAAPRQVVRTTTASRPSRNWTKTALIIGGSTAAGAGIGGIFGGKKGALIGAAIGGGASSIQQATR